jgi:hypothetical protein
MDPWALLAESRHPSPLKVGATVTSPAAFTSEPGRISDGERVTAQPQRLQPVPAARQRDGPTADARVANVCAGHDVCSSRFRTAPVRSITVPPDDRFRRIWAINVLFGPI